MERMRWALLVLAAGTGLWGCKCALPLPSAKGAWEGVPAVFLGRVERATIAMGETNGVNVDFQFERLP